MDEPSSPRTAAELRAARLLLGFDLAGTFVFAVEGAMAAVAADLDALGVVVLAFATALGGGIVRDVLIGATPPRSILDARYPTAAFVGGVLVLFVHRFVSHVPPLLFVALDAAGLSLFAIAGTRKARDFGIPPMLAVLMGAITGAGGGTIRDLFLARIPIVLRSDVYAVAAITGGAVMLGGQRLGAPARTMAFVGGFACFLLRMVSVLRGWSLPHG